MKLVEARTIILAVDVTLDCLQGLFKTLEAVFQRLNLIPRGSAAQEFGGALLSLGSLCLQILDDSVGSFVLKLNAASQVLEIRVKAPVCATVVNLSVNDRLLGSVALSGWWNSLALANSRLEHEFENLK